MNTSIDPTSECASKFNRLARENPTSSLLIALGVGLAAGLLVRTLRPHHAESRAARLLADLQDRLHDIAVPVQRQAQHLMDGGSEALSKGVAQLQDLQVGHRLQKLAKRFTGLFH